MLRPANVRAFSGQRNWVLHLLFDRLNVDSHNGNGKYAVKVIDHLNYAMSRSLVFMCFGERLSDEEMKEIEYVQRRLVTDLARYNVLRFWPTSVTKILLRKRWEELHQKRKERDDVLIPYIRARKKVREEKLEGGTNDGDEVIDVVSYVDTLLDLMLPEEKRKLEEGHLVTLCSEFLFGGITCGTTLEWIMANLVKYPHVQERVVEEMREVIGERGDKNKEVKEEDLVRLPYLKAVILEGLRRHPPRHFGMPHAVTEDVVLNGYSVPKNGTTVTFMLAEIGLNPKEWEHPMEFRPERFLNGGEAFDITGSREVKMMPFGVGPRICPGLNLAMLHLEYFVANLVWNFEWKPSNGDVDLSEKLEFTTVMMKHPLQVHISPQVVNISSAAFYSMY